MKNEVSGAWAVGQHNAANASLSRQSNRIMLNLTGFAFAVVFSSVSMRLASRVTFNLNLFKLD